jgi:hypothetical protein
MEKFGGLLDGMLQAQFNGAIWLRNRSEFLGFNWLKFWDFKSRWAASWGRGLSWIISFHGQTIQLDLGLKTNIIIW